MVNQDLSVSPTQAPFLVLGVKEDGLILVKDTDSDHKLVFDELKPTYDLKSLKVMNLKSFSHPGIGIVIKEDQHR